MVLDFHRQSAHARIVARALRHRPALHHAVELQTKIEVKMTRGVLLNDEAQRTFRLWARRPAFGLFRLGKIALPLVVAERFALRWRSFTRSHARSRGKRYAPVALRCRLFRPPSF